MKQNQQIAHLSSAHPSNDVRIYVKECQSLAKAGYRVHLVVGNDHKIKDSGDVNIVWVKKREGRFQRMLLTVLDVLRASLWLKADAYHFHDPELIPVGLCLKLCGKKVVYDVHEDLPRQVLNKKWIAKPLRVIISKVMEIVENIAVFFFDGVVAATPPIAQRFPDHKSITVFNYPILSRYSQVDVNADYQQRPHNIVYAGGIAEIRGIHEMVAVLGEIPESYRAKLQLIGRFFDDSTYQKIQNQQEWLQVDYHGMITHQEVYRAYNQSRIGLVLLHPIPNFIEAYPVKLFEYMSAGLPVIASDFPLWREIIEDSDCGILADPLNIKQISDAICYLFDNPIRAEEMGENGRKAVLEKYNWKSESDKLRRFYERLFLVS